MATASQRPRQLQVHRQQRSTRQRSRWPGDVCDSCPQSGESGQRAVPVHGQEPARSVARYAAAAWNQGDRQRSPRRRLRSLASFGFHARDRSGSRDYAGIWCSPAALPSRNHRHQDADQSRRHSSGGRYLTVFSGQDELATITELRVTGTDSVVPLDVRTRDLADGGRPPRRSGWVTCSCGSRRRDHAAPCHCRGADAFYVTDEAGQSCAEMLPPCAQVSDFCSTTTRPTASRSLPRRVRCGRR